MSKLDYCNAILHGSPKSSIAVLQRTQNSLARASRITTAKVYTSATLLLHVLHWLPVEQKIQLKLAVVTYKVRSTKTPVYLHRVLPERIPTTTTLRTLRSSSRPLLGVVRTKTACGQHAFRVAAPSTLNSLPVDIQLACSLNVFERRPKRFYVWAAFD